MRKPFPEARRPAYKLTVDFGPGNRPPPNLGPDHQYYGLDDLVGRQVLAVVNFPKKQIGKFMSEVLVLGVPTRGRGLLIAPEREVPIGGRLY